MDLDPSLAFTAILEMRPGNADPTLTGRLADAMTAANPPDRWAFARAWLDEHDPAGWRECEHGARVATCYHTPRCGPMHPGQAAGERPFGRYQATT